MKKFYTNNTMNNNMDSKNLFDSPISNTKSQDLTIYRLTINRTFKTPKGIRIDIKKTENNQKEIILSWTEGYKPGIEEEENSKTLNEKESQEIENLIEKMDFWNLKRNEDGLPGLDGGTCVFEVYDPSKKYHAIERWSPWARRKENEEYVELITYLINLAGIKIR
jgi:hypothetical protein